MQEKDQPIPPLSRGQVLRRVVPIVGVVVLVFILVSFSWLASQVLLATFASVLVAIFIDSVSRAIRRVIPISRGWSIGIVLLCMVAAAGGIGWLIVPSVAKQVDELSKTLPEQADKLESKLVQYRWGRLMLGMDMNAPAPGKEDTSSTTQPASTSQPTSQPTTQPGDQLTDTVKAAAKPVINEAPHWAAGLLNALVAALVVLAAGIYLALDPKTYIQGMLHLFPKARQPRITHVMDAMAYSLRWWIVAQLITMVAIGLLTGIGLYFIGVRLWMTFAILAALFNFVPNFGPLISFVPAVLFALAEPEGLNKAGWITGLYVVAQTFEGYVLTPMVQKKAVDTAPALLILFQVFATLLFGGLGLMLAAPLLAALVVAVKMLYVQDVLHNEIETPETG